jgi:hypothetical protein
MLRGCGAADGAAEYCHRTELRDELAPSGGHRRTLAVERCGIQRSAGSREREAKVAQKGRIDH